MKFVQYIILYHMMLGINNMHQQNDAITGLEGSPQNMLKTFVELIVWIVLIIGTLHSFPKDKYSNERVWFYYVIMGGLISAVNSFVELINTLSVV